MRAWSPLLVTFGLVCAASTPVCAASLQATPVMFELSAAKAADTLTLHNDGTTPISAQVRVQRWVQGAGEDKTEATTDVVASPPVVSIAPGGDQIVRIVRVSKNPIGKEESFRVTVDELPDKANEKPGVVSFTFKYSIPMFVAPATGSGKSSVTWAIERQDDKTFIVARNEGTRRLRIGGLTLKAPGGKEFVLGKGLNGYVLSGSIKRWVLPNTASSFGSTGEVIVTARSDEGPINATAQAQASARR